MPSPLFNILSRHQVLLEGLKSGYVADFGAAFAEVHTVLEELLGALRVDNLSQIRFNELQSLIGELTQVQSAIYDKHVNAFVAKMVPDLTAYSVDFDNRALRSVLPEKTAATVKKAPQRKAYDAALKRPIQATGDTLEGFVKDWSNKAIKNTNNAVRLGHQQGLTSRAILQRVTGTEALRYKDGVTALNKRSVATVINTSVQHVAMTARSVTYEENEDIVPGYIIIATLDGKTSTICRSLDRRKFKHGKGPVPPMHPNCRSSTAPDVPGLDFLDEGSTRSAMDGPTSADTSYYEWLKRQPADFQDATLGPVRAKLLRDGGLSSERFASLQLDKNFRPLTIQEMRDLEPLAFEKAGLGSRPTDVQESAIELMDRSRIPGRPGKGTATGKVWDIADDLETKLGRVPTRQEVLTEATAQNVNASTVGVQFGKWRKATGEVRLGTIAPDKGTALVAKEVRTATLELPNKLPPPKIAPAIPVQQAKAPVKAEANVGGSKEERWLKMREDLTKLSATKTRPSEASLAQARATLDYFTKTFPDGQGGINTVLLTRDSREFMRKNVELLKGADSVETVLAPTKAELRQALHEYLSRAGGDKTRAFTASFEKTLTAQHRERAQQAKEFLDSIVADRFKKGPFKVSLRPSGERGSSLYKREERLVLMSRDAETSIYVHEMAHHVEWESQTARKAALWIERRRLKATGDAGKRKPYGDRQDVLVFEDDFTKNGGSPYTSRIYEYFDGIPYSTEALSMGAERLYDDPLGFWRRDPDHFEYTVRTLLDLW